MQTGTLIALAIYFIAMLGIGFYAWRKSTADTEGYLLGGRDLGPAVTALSAGASDMSDAPALSAVTAGPRSRPPSR
jgi:Na+/proline symporter